MTDQVTRVPSTASQVAEALAGMPGILGISPRTVEFHLANCRRKLDVTSKGQLIATAIERGLLEL